MIALRTYRERTDPDPAFAILCGLTVVGIMPMLLLAGGFLLG